MLVFLAVPRRYARASRGHTFRERCRSSFLGVGLTRETYKGLNGCCVSGRPFSLFFHLHDVLPDIGSVAQELVAAFASGDGGSKRQVFHFPLQYLPVEFFLEAFHPCCCPCHAHSL